MKEIRAEGNKDHQAYRARVSEAEAHMKEMRAESSKNHRAYRARASARQTELDRLSAFTVMMK